MPYSDYEKYKAYQREYQKRWREGNPEKVRAIRERYRTASAKFRANNLEMVRKRDLTYHRNSKYGMNEFDYHSMVVAQAGRCGLCDQEFVRTPHIDHDHDTGRVRSLLCPNCNVGIGMLRHDPELLRKAAEYVTDVEEGDPGAA